MDVEQEQSSTVTALSTDRASVAASIEVVQRSHASLTFAIGALQAELESLAQKQLGQEEVLAEEEAKIEEINRAFAERTQVKLKVQRTASLLGTLIHARSSRDYDGQWCSLSFSLSLFVLLSVAFSRRSLFFLSFVSFFVRGAGCAAARTGR